MGDYFEALLHFWLKELLRFEQVHSGVAIRSKTATLGELDFVFKTASQQAMHWECAVKFYMCIARTEAEARGADQYVGQRLLDRLDIKVQRSLEHQLRLPSLPEAQARLEEIGLPAPLSRLFMRGRLFYPVERDWRNHPAPEGVSVHHLRGWWSAFDPTELKLPTNAGSRWVPLAKDRWLGAVLVNEEKSLSGSQLAELLGHHFEKSTNALQIAEVAQDTSGFWQEVSRGMILRQDWPSSAAS